MANAAPSCKADKRGRAETVIAEAAQERGWVRVLHRLHDHVWGRGQARLIIGYSPSRHTVHTALFYPQGFGTGYIDDPTPHHSVGGPGGCKLQVVLSWLATTSPISPHVPKLVVIACGADKLNRPAPARELYTSPHFRHALRAAQAYAGRTDSAVRILSAKHGLLELDTIVTPYDARFGQAGHIHPSQLSNQLTTLGAHTVTTLLPRRYLTALTEAARVHQDAGAHLTVIDLFAQARGIGYQRAVLSSLLNGHTRVRPGPQT